MAKVEWAEHYLPNDFELDWFPNENWKECDRHYVGEIVGTNRSLLGTTNAVVACTDGVVRTVDIDRIRVIAD